MVPKGKEIYDLFHINARILCNYLQQLWIRIQAVRLRKQAYMAYELQVNIIAEVYC